MYAAVRAVYLKRFVYFGPRTDGVWRANARDYRRRREKGTRYIGRKRGGEREWQRQTDGERERERESVRSIIIRSNGGGDGATRRADGQIHNVSRTQRRRSCRRGREGRRACRAQVHPAAAAPRRSHKGRRRRGPSCAVVGAFAFRGKGGYFRSP